MTLPTHTLRVPRRVVDEVFGSELETIAAINRHVRDRDRRLGGHPILPREETIELVVPHDTWERFRDGRGAMDLVKLRNVITLAALDRAQERDGRQPGTLMIAQKETTCPFCEKPIEPENPMVNTYAPDGSTQAAHVRCANKENIPYRATSKLLDGIAFLRRRAVERWLEKQLEAAKRR